MLLTVKRWGNSYALRLTTADLRRLGVREGQAVQVQLQPARPDAVDVSAAPVFRAGMGLEEARADHAAARAARWNGARR